MSRITNPFIQSSRHSRWALVVSIAGVCLLGVIAYASIPDANGVIHGCYKRSGGTLRIIDDAVGQCDNNEAPIQWSQTGPQGPPGAEASPRLITIDTANGTFGLMGCSQAIRSKEFVKQSDTSTLRITYHDHFYASFSNTQASPTYDIKVRIDGAGTSPTPIYSRLSNPSLALDVRDFTAFGYADGLSAGTHTLTTHFDPYSFQPSQCYRGDAYTLEIEEMSF